MANSDSPTATTRSVQRLGVLVVHGVGEQRRFEHLESIASNFHKVLLRDSARNAHVEIQDNKDDDPVTPVVVHWRGADNRDFEAHFREVYWADLDEEPSLWNWLKLVGWAIAMPGVRRFGESRHEGAWPNMRLPRSVGWLEAAWVRVQLFIISLLFLIMLISVDVGYWLLRRLSFSPHWLSRVRFLIYNHLGDVKLYQDWFKRGDANMEVHGELSRVAIRRRMIKMLVQTARDVHEGKLDGYYVVGHSLGSVVAFNGLMEHGHVLTNYLSSVEWAGLPSVFKQHVDGPAPAREVPPRPPWLHPGDAIDRRALFAGLRGFLTMGSPLNKFATLWPALVPVNDDAAFNDVPWINVADCQDIVAGKVSLFAKTGDSNDIGGLKVRNIECADQLTLATAHTRYWRAGKKHRLIDCLVRWIEGLPFAEPRARMSTVTAYTAYTAALVVLAVTPVVLLAYLSWVMNNSSEIISKIVNDTVSTADSTGWALHLFDLLTDVTAKTLYERSFDTFVYSGAIVLSFALARHAWERWRFRPQRSSS